MSEKHVHKVGDRVEVLNATLGGSLIREGYAIVRRLLETENRYLVQFEGETDLFERFVAP